MAGASVSVTVEGGEGLLRKLRQIGADVESELEAAALVGAAVIQNAANPLAPGPHVETEVAEKSPERVVVEIGPDEAHWYYRFFETGAGPHGITGEPLVFEGRTGTVVVPGVSHPGMAARPFLRPAFDGSSDRAADKVGEALKRVVER